MTAIPLWTPRIGGSPDFVRGIARFSGIDSYHPDPILTDIFREGDPQFQKSLGEFLFPVVDVGAPYIRIPIHGGGEQYLRHNTERGLRAPHTEISDTVSTRTFGYADWGVKGGLDFREIELSEAAFRRRELLVQLLSEALRVDQEVIRFDLLADANFPASHVVDLTGSEWNLAGGDSAGDLEAALDVLRVTHPWVQPEHVELVMTFAVKRACLLDPTYLAAKGSIEFRKATLSEWISYAAADFVRVEVGDLLVKTDPNASEAALWGETAFLKIVDQDKQFVDENRGRRSFAAEHRFNGGVVQGLVGVQGAQGFVDLDRSTEWILADRRTRQFVHNYNRAVKLTNMVG